MDSIAHGLAGAVVGYCGFRQKAGRAALWASVAASQWPDSDIVMLLVSGETYLRWHRGVTHSALLLPVWSALVAWAVWELSGKRNFRWLWGAAATSMAGHIVLDWITNYGTMLAAPFSDARFALSWVFIVDVYVWAALLLTLLAAIWSQRPAVARAGLALLGAYLLFCGASRAWALGGQPDTTQAYPQPMNPLRWTLVRAEGDTIHWQDGVRNDTFVQYRDDVLLPKAEATDAVKLFRWFAAFPLVERLEQDGHTVLRYRDLRFRTPMPWGGVREGLFVAAKVVFDKQGHVVAAGVTGQE